MYARKLIPVLMLFAVAPFVSAQANVTQLPSPGILPDNIFYPVKTIFESIDLFFTFNQTARIHKEMHYAEERLAEVQALVQENKTQYINKSLSGYKLMRDAVLASIQSMNNTTLYNMIENRLKIHQEILNNVEHRCNTNPRCKGTIGLEIAKEKSNVTSMAEHMHQMAMNITKKFRNRPEMPSRPPVHYAW